jgi:hypothetical protein
MTRANPVGQTGHCISCALRAVLHTFTVPIQLRVAAAASSSLQSSSARPFHSSHARHTPDRSEIDQSRQIPAQKWLPALKPQGDHVKAPRRERYSGPRYPVGSEHSQRLAGHKNTNDSPEGPIKGELTGQIAPGKSSKTLIPPIQQRGTKRLRLGPVTGTSSAAGDASLETPGNFRTRRLGIWRARLVELALDKIETDFRVSDLHADLDMTKSEFTSIFKDFRSEVEDAFSGNPSRKLAPDIRTVHDEIVAKYQQGMPHTVVQPPLKYAFYNRSMAKKFSPALIKSQAALADLRYPMEWYPLARNLQRTIHLHVGPTNSGKTHTALKRLEEAEKGVYASPLRLLAHEIYTRMNARGKACRLVTGDDVQTAPDNKEASVTSCTVEMAPMAGRLDVAVIDEIQMISDGENDRGHAWTAAVIGIPAKEVHLCGEERAVPLIQDIAAWLGEELIIHRYNRLSPLKVEDKPMKSLRNLEKGDCIVAFSTLEIHGLRKQIEEQTGKRVAVIYGTLPPETRAQQAKLFNDPNNDYDYLVASDAVGMGLNL